MTAEQFGPAWVLHERAGGRAADGHDQGEPCWRCDPPVATTRHETSHLGDGSPVIVHRWREGHVPPTFMHDEGNPCGWCDQ